MKRETALVSYNDLDARHSGDGVILLVGLRSYAAYAKAVIMFVSYGATPTVRDIFRSNLNFDLATFTLYTCF